MHVKFQIRAGACMGHSASYREERRHRDCREAEHVVTLDVKLRGDKVLGKHEAHPGAQLVELLHAVLDASHLLLTKLPFLLAALLHKRLPLLSAVWAGFAAHS